MVETRVVLVAMSVVVAVVVVTIEVSVVVGHRWWQ